MVVQVIDKSNMIVRAIDANDDKESLLWLKGWTTHGVVDDQQMEESTGVMITGTKTYATALGGTNTVFVAEPCDLEDWIEIVPETEAIAAAAARPVATAPSDAVVRPAPLKTNSPSPSRTHAQQTDPFE